MNCKTTVGMLSAYLDRELGTGERNAVRAHLADCDRCRAEERDLRSLKGILLGVRAPEPAEDFERRLMSRLREEKARPLRTFSFPSLSPAVWGRIGGLAATAAMGLAVMATHSAPRAEGSPLVRVERPATTPRATDDATDKYVAYSGADSFAGGTTMLTDGP